MTDHFALQSFALALAIARARDDFVWANITEVFNIAMPSKIRDFKRIGLVARGV